jgi:hypothetical protein
MYQLADLYKQSKEVDIFTMGKGGGAKRKDTKCVVLLI